MKTTRPVFPTPASIITTERLLLRPIKVDDLEDFYKLRTQIEVMQWTTRGKVDEDRAFTTGWMERFLPPNDSVSFNFAVEELSSPGRIVGTLGSHIAEPPEVGYMFRKDAWGKGYATEGLRAWLKVYWSLPRKEVDVDDETPGSERQNQKVLQKCGFVESGFEMVPDNRDPDKQVRLINFYHKRPLATS